jgi:hypothetical protein
MELGSRIVVLLTITKKSTKFGFSRQFVVDLGT